MKKLILGAIMMIGFISFTSAQKTDSTTKKHTAKKATAAKPATTTAVTATPKTATATKPAATPGALPKDTTGKKHKAPKKP